MHVERVAFAREARVIGAPRLAVIRCVNAVTVAAHPLADFRQRADGFLGHTAIGARPDVQEVVAGVARARNQILNDASRALPIVIGPLVSPTVVESHARLPRAAFFIRGDLLLGSGKIARKLVAIVDDDVWLKLKDHFIHALGLPTKGVERPRDVVPENINFSVIGEQLANVRVNVFDEAPARRLVGGAASAVGMVPVHQ